MTTIACWRGIATGYDKTAEPYQVAVTRLASYGGGTPQLTSFRRQ